MKEKLKRFLLLSFMRKGLLSLGQAMILAGYSKRTFMDCWETTKYQFLITLKLN